RRSGKTWTRRANDAAIAKAVKQYRQALGGKHGDQRKAVKDVAKQFRVSIPTVLKSIRSKSYVINQPYIINSYSSLQLVHDTTNAVARLTCTVTRKRGPCTNVPHEFSRRFRRPRTVRR